MCSILSSYTMSFTFDKSIFYRDKKEYLAFTITIIVGLSNRASNLNKPIKKFNENTKNKRII